MTLQEKIQEFYAGLVVRKDLSNLVKGNALVPTYVLEYLLGQYCATSDEDSIKSGIETVKNILESHYVNRNEAELIKSRIKEEGRYKIIDRITVQINDRTGIYEAVFSNLGLKKVVVDSDYIKEHPKLLVGGVWCILDMEYQYEDNPSHVPWVIYTLKPIQISNVDLETFRETRFEFSRDEWIDLIIQSLGLNPIELGERNKLFQLVRLVSYCENNYNLIELGPKGTGKSHIFSEFSPHGILISGGEVTLAKLFVNNSNGRLGLLGYWDVVAFDEFAGRSKKADKILIDVMKNYMANHSFSRGTEQIPAAASMSFVGNTSKSLNYLLRQAHLFDDLPILYQDSAFLDRLHFYIPGWEVNIIRSEMFTTEYGFIVDYLAQVLKLMRFQDYSDLYTPYFEIDSTLSTRDKIGINKTFSGLMKIIYPHREASKEEIEYILRFAMEGRKRVKLELYKIDTTYDPVYFRYKDLATGEIKEVMTHEEIRFPHYFRKLTTADEIAGAINSSQTKINSDNRSTETKSVVSFAPEPPCFSKRIPGVSTQSPAGSSTELDNSTSTSSLIEDEIDYPSEQWKTIYLKENRSISILENESGVSYHRLFSYYLRGARRIELQDPYIRKGYQIRNLMEFIQVLVETKEEGEDIYFHLVTSSGDIKLSEIEPHFREIADQLISLDINFSYTFNESIHDRFITTDTGWKIILGRGLDIFQKWDSGFFGFEQISQEARLTKAFEVSYLKELKNDQ